MTSPNTLLNLPAPLVLASSSPRRQSLLTKVGFEFSVVVPQVDEEAVVPTAPYEEYVTHLAQLKAESGLSMVQNNVIVIGSDTTVVLDGKVLNKPADHADARRMLWALSNNTHTVFTGLAIASRYNGAEQVYTTVSTTDVTFRALGSSEIDSYVQSGLPLDKAGSYGIQDDFGALFVESVRGCYYTVVGLPLSLLYTSLQQVVSRL